MYYVNINIVGQTLFIGLKNKTTQERVDQLLGDDMLNKEHYYRLEKRKSKRKKQKDFSQGT
jgi:methyltransferase-like protein